MNRKIKRLSEDVINKIAAGEVVESPISIAKELIENSLDAGASRIALRIEEGGVSLLCIEDDGFGMSPEDLPLALERHATSKIVTENDLFSLQTMGFRGEALAAIAAVSRLEIKTSEGMTGSRIASSGGDVSPLSPCARNRGTTVIVRDLFFNVPARKKFLKSARSYGLQMIRLLEALSLAHPHTGFSLVSDGRDVFSVSPQTKGERIAAIVKGLDYEVSGDHFWAAMSAPEASRRDRTGQYVFVNNRFVSSPLISKAVKAGYGTSIGENDHPSFVLYLSIPPCSVDVNVHPQKKEVRFAESDSIFRSIRGAVSAAIAPGPFPLSQEITFSPSVCSFDPVSADFFEKRASMEPLFLPLAPTARPLAVVSGYLIVQTDQLLIVDLKAAHARVLYESLQNKTFTLQNLLFPIEIPLEEETEKDLASMGIECRRLSETTGAVDAIPSLMEREGFLLFLDAWKRQKRLDLAVHACALQTKKRYSLEEGMVLWQQLAKCCASLFCPRGQKIWGEMSSEKLKKMLETL